MKTIACISTGFLLTLFTQCISNAQELPIDKHATKETINLYRNLEKLRYKGFMFGHQDDLAYGVDWKYENGRSDIKDVTGDFPAVYGWELGHLEIDNPKNLDDVPFATMQQLIKDGYERGGVITISWHLNNPLTGKTAWDPAEGTVAAILPGGSKNELYRSWLDKLAGFMMELKGKNGEYIPVVFRPYHELNGSWFWWGGKNCTPDEFKALWKYTVSYLRDEKKLHHLLYAFNTDRFQTRDEYLERYPGNDWVDIIGFDIYQRNSPKEKYMEDFDRMLSMLETIAKEKNKIPALTEFGGNMNDEEWWTKTFYPVLAKHNIAWVLGWRNAGAKPGGQFEFYVPYRGQKTEKDFINFYKLDKTLFQADVAGMNLYQPGK